VYSEKDHCLDGRAALNRCSLLDQFLSIIQVAKLPFFRWLLPAQGQPIHFTSSEDTQAAIAEAAMRFYNNSGEEFGRAHRDAFLQTDIRVGGRARRE